MIEKATLLKMAAILKWAKIIAKLTAIGTAITGAVSALTSSSATTGLALGAAGATTYATAKVIPVHGYERTRHISPLAGAHAISKRGTKSFAAPAHLLRRKQG